MKRSRKLPQKNYSKRPIKIDTSSLFNHLKLIQRSSLQLEENDSTVPRLTMHNYQYLVRGDLQDIYILVAWTKYAVSCQMVVLDKAENCSSNTPVFVPDLVRCTPISVWTTAATQKMSADDNNNHDDVGGFEYLSCEPRIMIDDQDDLTDCDSTVKKCMNLAIILGTNCGRVLSVQLKIHAHEQEMDASYSLYRHILLKSEKDIFEPLLSQRKRPNKTSTANSNPDIKGSWSQFQGAIGSISHVYKYDGALIPKNSVSMKENKKFRSEMFVWIVWEGGTFVRLSKRAFFLRKVPYTDEEESFFTKFLFKGCIDSVMSSHRNLAIVPLPKSFPSFLSRPYDEFDSGEEEDDENDMELSDETYSRKQLFAKTNIHEPCEAITYQQDNFSSIPDVSIPTVSFYTTEEHLQSHNNTTDRIKISTQTDVVGEPLWKILIDSKTVIASTSSLARGVLGGMMGAITGRTKNSQTESDIKYTEKMVAKKNEVTSQEPLATRNGCSFLPKLQEPPEMLYFSTSIYDGQRRITHSTVDPLEGRLMACSDNLGRVSLIDLESKQIIRVWKGFRDAICSWVQCPYAIDGELHRVKYLVIHSRQRHVIEIYRMDHGPVVAKIDIKNHFGTVVQCAVQIGGGDMYVRCFVLNAGLSSRKCKVAKELTIFDEELRTASMQSSSSFGMDGFRTSVFDPGQVVDSKISVQLQMLKQLLSSDSSLSSSHHSIFDAFFSIDALSDISHALDIVALSPFLEQAIESTDSSFHLKLISHAKQRLNEATVDSTSNNAHLRQLNMQIEFHSQLHAAYHEIFKFESEESSSIQAYNQMDGDLSAWVQEAFQWIETYEMVAEQSIDAHLIYHLVDHLKFSTFSKACIRSDVSKLRRNAEGTLVMFLCESSRDRKEVLLHIFCPLTRDIFSLKTATTIFQFMGLSREYDKLLQYFGEWFLLLSRDIYVKQIRCISCPIVRWLHDVILEILNEYDFASESSNTDFLLLKPLLKICEDSDDLPRAFLLSSVCHTAISIATKSVDDKTYGVVTRESCLGPWIQMLRKLRVCLLCSLRLHDAPRGAITLTVSTLADANLISIYQWIAYDELQMVDDDTDILKLEECILKNPTAFHPFSEAGDYSRNVQILQQGCINRRCIINLTSSQESLSCSLLSCFTNYNNSDMCASHRALIHASAWAREPSTLDKLSEVLKSVESIVNRSLVCIIIQEIWNIFIRPIFRGMMFSFDEINEVSHEVILPLCESSSWFTEFNQISLKMLDILGRLLDQTDNVNDTKHIAVFLSCDKSSICLSNDIWPPERADHIISRLFQKYDVEPSISAVQAHKAVVAALSLSDDWSSLPQCVENLGNMFLPNSLHQETSPVLISNQNQIDYIENAIESKANSFQLKSVKMDDLNDIITLGQTWGMLKTEVVSIFLTSMYEMGKDKLIEGFLDLISNLKLLDSDEFVERVIPIVCVRLRAAFYNLKKIKRCRGILNSLDADTCEWVKEQAEIVEEERPGKISTCADTGKMISLDVTYDLILRLKRMSNNGEDACALRSMCEVLLKASEQATS